MNPGSIKTSVLPVIKLIHLSIIITMTGIVQLSSLLLVVASLASAGIVPFETFSTRAITFNFEGHENLDADGKYVVRWKVDEAEKRIHFEVTAETVGYVGFGFSPSGGMAGADIFIAGVTPDGQKYSADYHAVANGAPILDEQQDYTLINATETTTNTTIAFTRLLNTCDEQDFQITDETMKLIWSMGQTDDIQYHGNDRRGTHSVNFYLANEDFDAGSYQKIDLTNNRTMGGVHTEYWCTIHELPRFDKPQHIVAFEPILENADALTHTHHFLFYRCLAPDGQDPDTFFQKWTNHPGDYCYEQRDASFPFAEYCSENTVYVWSKGGRRMVFPPELGLPMPDKPGVKEYFAMEIHYDNPAVFSGKTFSTGGRMYYTDALRETEVGLMMVGADTHPTLTIPPQASDYVVAGHCSPECTEEMLPETGITAFNNFLHAHLAGRKIKLRHWRDGNELPWLDKDDYYDFDYQQNKPLQHPRQILKGDQLTVECTFDSMKVKDRKAVIGGLSSQEEMCQGWFFYYPWSTSIEVRCESRQNLRSHMALLGITEWRDVESEVPGGSERIEVTAPEHLRGDYRDVISYNVTWTEEFRQRFQQEKRYGAQEAKCNAAWRQEEVKYPENFEEYKPDNNCTSDASKRWFQ